jgi:glycerol-3-phosphate dehydrogenase
VKTFDVAVIGAGIVGAAIARDLAGADLSVALLEAKADVGDGTSKANTAILHTGFDAKPGTLESRLVARGYDFSGPTPHRPASLSSARERCSSPGPTKSWSPFPD